MRLEGNIITRGILYKDEMDKQTPKGKDAIVKATLMNMANSIYVEYMEREEGWLDDVYAENGVLTMVVSERPVYGSEAKLIKR